LKDYDRMLEEPARMVSRKSHITGIMFGFS